MKLVHNIMSLYLKTRRRKIRAFIDNPIETQLEVFEELLEFGRATKWGKQYAYHDIQSIQDFQNRVPVQDYDSLKPYIERMLAGEPRVLWPSKVSWFAKSSGTTSDKSKFIPVSQESLQGCHFKASKDLLSLYLDLRPDSTLFAGKGLVMGGSHQVNQQSDETFSGDLSAVLTQNMPWAGQYFREPDLETALMDKWDEKIERMAQQTIDQNITSISGVPTWTLVLIKRIFEITGKDNLVDVWPGLELYIHGGVSFTPYRHQFEQLIRSPQMAYLETYNASEGFFAIQNDFDSDDMLLMLDYGIFYEFIPMEEWDSDNPKTVWLDEVEVGKNYAVVISTNGGLWRYKIGDTVQFTSTSPYKIKISGRTKHFINVFGEEVIIDNANRALAKACKATGAVVADFTVAPVFLTTEDKGGHEWLIEFEREPENTGEFARLLDDALREVNSDYDAKRFKDMALLQLQLKKVPRGTFQNWLRSKGKLGGQHKVPRLSNKREYVDEILAFVNKA